MSSYQFHSYGLPLTSSQLAPGDEREPQRAEMDSDDRKIQEWEAQRDEEDNDYTRSQESSQDSWIFSSQSTETDEERQQTTTHGHEAKEVGEPRNSAVDREDEQNERVPLFLPSSQPEEWGLHLEDRPVEYETDRPDDVKRICKKLTEGQLGLIKSAIDRSEVCDGDGKELVMDTIAILYGIKRSELSRLLVWLDEGSE